MDCNNFKQLVKDKEYYLNSTKQLTDKKAQFRKYLDTSGVLNKLTSIFIDLYENPVKNFPINEYVRKTLSEPNPVKEEIAKTRQMLEEAKSRRDVVEKKNKHLIALCRSRETCTIYAEEEPN